MCRKPSAQKSPPSRRSGPIGWPLDLSDSPFSSSPAMATYSLHTSFCAAQTGLRAILNTVLDSRGSLVGATYGDPQRAFRWGAGLARQIYGVAVPALADIVVAGSSPCDSEFWQAHKTLYPAERCVRPGGTIIVVTPCPEGVAATPIPAGLAGLF